jgi:HEAT repeat protein
MAIKRNAARKSKAARTPNSGRAVAGGSKPLAIATNKQKAVAERITALSQASLNVNESNLEKIMGVLGDPDEPFKVRLAALQSLQAASFNVTAFEPSSGSYRATLRKVAQDGNPEIRQQALSALAQQKDGFAQKKLLQGLQDPAKALVPPEKALQLLSYDVHADAYKAARAIVEDPPNPVAKREALRLLAADPTSAQMFEKILLDKDELRENRQVSATALHSLEPDKFQTLARNIVLDSGDYDDIQATSLTALTQFGDEAKVATDQSLRQSVDRMKTKGSAKLQQSAKQFLSRYSG